MCRIDEANEKRGQAVPKVWLGSVPVGRELLAIPRVSRCSALSMSCVPRNASGLNRFAKREFTHSWHTPRSDAVIARDFWRAITLSWLCIFDCSTRQVQSRRSRNSLINHRSVRERSSSQRVPAHSHFRCARERRDRRLHRGRPHQDVMVRA